MQESDFEFGQMHDRWLMNYQTGTEVVYCSNPKCDLHQDGAEVAWESEYGQGWWIPEECPRCHSEWVQDRPEPEEEDEDDQWRPIGPLEHRSVSKDADGLDGDTPAPNSAMEFISTNVKDASGTFPLKGEDSQ